MAYFTLERSFMIGCIVIAALFGWSFLTAAGFPPKDIKEHWPPLLIFIVFFLLPFGKKVDFFQFFSFEAKLDDMKKEAKETKETSEKVTDVRQDIRHVIAQQNALNASIQSQNHNTVNVYQSPPP